MLVPAHGIRAGGRCIGYEARRQLSNTNGRVGGMRRCGVCQVSRQWLEACSHTNIRSLLAAHLHATGFRGLHFS